MGKLYQEFNYVKYSLSKLPIDIYLNCDYDLFVQEISIYSANFTEYLINDLSKINSKKQKRNIVESYINELKANTDWDDMLSINPGLLSQNFYNLTVNLDIYRKKLSTQSLSHIIDLVNKYHHISKISSYVHDNHVPKYLNQVGYYGDLSNFKIYACRRSQMVQYVELAFTLYRLGGLEMDNTDDGLKGKRLSFEFKGWYKKNAVIELKERLLNLQDYLPIIKEPSTIDDLIGVIISKDLFNIKTNIHLMCDTADFVYIIGKLKKDFYNLNHTSIGKSKLFISKKGNIITKNNLDSTKFQSPESKNADIIDNIFKEK